MEISHTLYIICYILYVIYYTHTSHTPKKIEAWPSLEILLSSHFCKSKQQKKFQNFAFN